MAEVCKRHAVGVFLKHAAAEAGGDYEGLKDARERDPEIALMLAKAHAEGVRYLRSRLDETGIEEGEDGRKIRYGDWKREAWLLERFDREAFAPPTSKVDAVVKDERSSDETLALVATVVLGVKREGGE